ncbi:monooxygenase [Deinococcus cellulosilyticus]|uniref:Copper type II ascorbate-dependent monooxygenase C-terminal domain-containing protein n=1 Tax=Deinococcus cellulosilyticus (strain DSM 18568 / NBRC 106333 / KACC 11606 / 5516J-15) TaxID=1223518 RepID=A0A511N366_DEIC1|nr:hypothetical protein [Deinococcus cellulosilyticus]GEM47282.1 hypothetical protein DC3_29170 [Deinococcus cellulosilyticus NBRC 106333 = KACC 11606]
MKRLCFVLGILMSGMVLAQHAHSAAAPSGFHPDLDLKMAHPYTPDSAYTDDYRCFVLDPGLTTDRYITGYQVVPGNLQEVHHVILSMVPKEQRDQVLAKDGQDGRPGWTCFGGAGVGTGGAKGAAVLLGLRDSGVDLNLAFRAFRTGNGDPLNTLQTYQQLGGNPMQLLQAMKSTGMTPEGLKNSSPAQQLGSMGLGSWTPGSQATLFPEGSGRRFPAGSLVVMQVHYNTHMGLEPDQSTLKLQLAPEGSTLDPLKGMVMAAPVEIPCMGDAQTPLCSRDQAIEASKKLDGPVAEARPVGLLAVCGKTLEDYRDKDPRQATSSCDYPVQQDALAVGAILHMHTLGARASLVLNPDTPHEMTLLEIPHWDFHWQGDYWYQNPIPLKKGDTVRIECVWDASRAQNPKYVVWGEGTEDEMCLGSLTLRSTQ